MAMAMKHKVLRLIPWMCVGAVGSRIIIDGHTDASWEYTLLASLGGMAIGGLVLTVLYVASSLFEREKTDGKG